MKKPRNVEPTKVNPKLCRNRAKNIDFEDDIERKNFCDISFPLFFSFWCIVVLFHGKFGVTRGNEGELFAYNGSMNNKCHDVKLWSDTLPVPVTENEHDNHTGVVMEQDVFASTNDSSIRNTPPKIEDSTRGMSQLEELASVVLGYDPFTCRISPHEDGNKREPEPQQNERSQLTYPNLDDFKHISIQEKSSSSRQVVNITHRLEPDGTPYNYAAASKGAKVVSHNKEAKGASNVLGKDHDKYLRNPCSAEGKFFIIELADETLVDAVKIANFEHHSSNFKDFELSGSLVYPTETWDILGSFIAANSKHAQSFKLPEPKWVRFLKVKLQSHYGSEFYCTLSVVEVFGVDAIEQMLEDLIVPAAESTTKASPNPNSTTLPLVTPEPSSNNPETDEGQKENLAETVSKGVGGVDEGQNSTSDTPKKPVPITSIPDSLLKPRQHLNNRLHADAALKVVLQKVRVLEMNLSVLEEYIKELNKRRGDYLPMIDKELSNFSVLLEKAKFELKNLLEWKEIMEKGIFELESWRAVVSTQLDLLADQNSMLRLEIEKVLQDQVRLENKELAILTLCLCFACIAVFKLSFERLVKYFCNPTLIWSNRGWILILVFCSSTMLIPVIYG